MQITFNTADNLIIVFCENEETTYKTAADYLADWPEREADVIAMGWQLPE